jgi:nucleoside-diphosphate-sugar epimerase
MRKAIKRVLITGASGFIGKNVVDGLVDKDEIVCIVKNRSYRRGGVKIIYGDVTDENVIKNAVKSIDAIVHLAAILNPLDRDIGKVNVGATRLLVSAAKDAGVEKFVFVSTENVLYDFDDSYSVTKRSAERIVMTFRNHLILRPTLVYGKYDEKYVKRIVDIIDKYKFVPIPGSGKKLFQPVYIEDVVKCIGNSLKYDVRGEYVVAGPSKINYDELVVGILKELGTKRKLIHIPLSVLKMVDYVNKNFIRMSRLRIFQLKSLEIDKIYDISNTVKALRYRPTPFNVGIRKTVKLLKDL